MKLKNGINKVSKGIKYLYQDMWYDGMKDSLTAISEGKNKAFNLFKLIVNFVGCAIFTAATIYIVGSLILKLFW